MNKMSSLVLILSFVIASCSKDSDDPQILSNTEYLTNNTWRVKELIQQSGNVQSSFVRGGSNTTGSDYSVARLKFNTDGTGSFTDPEGDTYTLTWSFASGNESKMMVVVNYPVPAPLNYSFVFIDENNFVHTIHYTEQGNNVLATAHYEPAP